MICIIPFEPRYREGIWEIIRQVISTGDTYVFDPKSTKEDILDYWLSLDKHCYIAIKDNQVVGTFILKQNQAGLGNHIANASYMVLPQAHGQRIGRKMAEFSLEEAVRLGFRAMQFNIVVKSNIHAIKLWQDLGFEIIGEIPDAFRHAKLGLTNAFIMHKVLV